MYKTETENAAVLIKISRTCTSMHYNANLSAGRGGGMFNPIFM